MSRSGVTPIAYIGDITTGAGSDQVRAVYLKYNDHDHQRVSNGNWLSFGIQPLAKVVCLNDCLETLLVSNTKVSAISENNILLSYPALVTKTNITIKFINPDNSEVYVQKCNVTANSVVVRTTSCHGLITPEQVNSSFKTTFSGIFNPTVTGNYPIIINPHSNLNITDVILYCPVGSCTIQPNILNNQFNVVYSKNTYAVNNSIQQITHSYNTQTDNFLLKSNQILNLAVSVLATNTCVSYTIKGVYVTPLTSIA